MENTCPKCNSSKVVKSGIINEKQRFHCKNCNYYFTVKKLGKQIDDYYVTKALQLYLEGLSYREIERIIGVLMSPSARGLKNTTSQDLPILNFILSIKSSSKTSLLSILPRKKILKIQELSLLNLRTSTC